MCSSVRENRCDDTGYLRHMHDLRVPVRGGGSINVWHRPAAPGSPTVLLIHGLTGTSRWWIPVISHLPVELGVAVPDVRGRGGSKSAPGPYDIATMADDLVSVADHLDITEPTVAGYSMGAWVSSVFSKRHPDRAERIVMIDGGLRVPLDETMEEDQILDSLIGPSLRRLSSTFNNREAYFDFYRQHPAFVGWWHAGLETVFEYELQEVDGSLTVGVDADAIAESGRDFFLNNDVIDAALHSKVPIELLIVDHGMIGQAGGFIPLEVARAAADTNPNLHYTMLEGLNHYSLMLGPGAPQVAKSITGHLDSV